MNRNTKEPEQSFTITKMEKDYRERERILYDQMIQPIKDTHKACIVITVEEFGSKGWANQTLKEIVIKEMAAKGWGWRTGNYVNGKTKTFDFVFIGTPTYKGPGIASVLTEVFA